MTFGRSLRMMALPALAACLMAAGCLGLSDFLPIGTGAKPAAAQTGPPATAPPPMTPEERFARGSAVVAEKVNNAAHVAELVPVPGVAQGAIFADRYTIGYLDEIKRQIEGLEARKASDVPPAGVDYKMAVFYALCAGGLNLLGVRHGIKLGAKPAG